MEYELSPGLAAFVEKMELRMQRRSRVHLTDDNLLGQIETSLGLAMKASAAGRCDCLNAVGFLTHELEERAAVTGNDTALRRVVLMENSI